MDSMYLHEHSACIQYCSHSLTCRASLLAESQQLGSSEPVGEPDVLLQLVDNIDNLQTGFSIDSASQFVYFLADLDTLSVSELYRVAFDDPLNVVKVSGEGVISGVSNFNLSPNSQFVVYSADHEQLATAELYLVDAMAPGLFIKLNADFGLGSSVRRELEITRDNNKIIYIADPQGLGQLELFVVDFDFPGQPFRISQTMPTALQQVFDFYVTQAGDLQ